MKCPIDVEKKVAEMRQELHPDALVEDAYRAILGAMNGAYCDGLQGKGAPGDLAAAISDAERSLGEFAGVVQGRIDKAFGFYCRGAAKPPGSVEYSMKWLGRLAAIVIDPERCPRTAKEFSEYEFERDKDGNLISAYPDAKNHHIDAVRYGMQPVWKQRGE